MDKLKAFLLVNRFEFTPVSQGILLSFIVLNAQNWSQVLTLPVLLAFLSYNIATYWGGALNVYFDYSFDKVSIAKKHLPQAVDLLGKKFVRGMLWGEGVSFLFLGGVLSYIRQKPIIFALLLVGTFFTIAYSIEPLRFKRRGFLNSLSLFLIIMFLPPLYGWFTINDNMPYYVFLMISGLALVQYGFGLYYTTVDYSEDKAFGIVTPSVKLGVTKAVKVSLLLICVGSALLLIGFRNSSQFSWVGFSVIFVGQVLPFMDMLRLLLLSGYNDSVLENIMKQNDNRIPMWVALSALSVLVACILHLL